MKLRGPSASEQVRCRRCPLLKCRCRAPITQRVKKRCCFVARETRSGQSTVASLVAARGKSNVVGAPSAMEAGQWDVGVAEDVGGQGGSCDVGGVVLRVALPAIGVR